MKGLFFYTFSLLGFPIKNALKNFSQLEKLSDEEIKIFREKKKWEIFNYHLKHNSFYRNFIGDRQIERWQDIPIIRKQNMQSPIQERLSDEFINKKMHISHTSGSTGVPMYFAKDKYAHAVTWADIYRMYGWHGVNINRDLQARFYGVPTSLLAYISEKMKDMLLHRVRFNVSESNDSILEKNLQKFKSHKFGYINGYSRSLTTFAKYLLKRKILLKEICPTLKCVIVTSGILTHEDRGYMQKAFGVKIINEYGASEIGIIALENQENQWLISDDVVYVELVDDNGKLITDGKTQGHLLITALYNQAMPFVRYEIGDIGIIDNKSHPRFHVLKQLIGRNNDYMILKDGSHVSIVIIEHAIKHILQDNYALKEYIIRQYSPLLFEFEFVSDEEISHKDQDLAQKIMNEKLGYSVEFKFKKVTYIERTNSWKLRYFERKFN